MRICTKCKIEKPLEYFHRMTGRKYNKRPTCKVCVLKDNDAYNARSEVKEHQKEWGADYRSRPGNRERKNAYLEEYNQRPSVKLHKRLQEQLKLDNDIQYKLACSLRDRLRKAIKGNAKVGSAVVDLGCPIVFFKKYLESKFQLGMNWENWGLGNEKWHIDHIKPLIKFDLTDREQLLIACHYTNLQPLWQKDNLKKGARE